MLKFFNYIYRTGIPHQWREAKVIPLLKPGKIATLASSYRPIALTNCMCKTLEKMVNRRRQHFLESNKYFNPCQSGFRAAHCTVDSLIRLDHSARQAILLKQYCIAVFLDIEKAFDSVWHHGILLKLQAMGIKGYLPKFIQQFLSMRKISVKIGSSSSPQYPVHSGVPQGSVISPTLFTIAINDLFNKLPEQIQTSLYADDGALWIRHESLHRLEACSLVQQGLNTIEKWSDLWGLTISPLHTKTCSVIFSYQHSSNAQNLYLRGSKIPYVAKAQKISWADF